MPKTVESHGKVRAPPAEIRRAFEREGISIEARIRGDSAKSRDYWKWQIVATARNHDYYAQLDRPGRWVGLRLTLPDIERGDARLVFSFTPSAVPQASRP